MLMFERTFAFYYSLGLYQWSDAVIRKVTRLWDIRGGVMVRHEVHLLVTPRVVVKILLLSSSLLNHVFTCICHW